MTEEQKSWIRETEQQILEDPAGAEYKVYFSISIVRIQHMRINKQYRMMHVEDHTTKDQISETMMKAFHDMESDINSGGAQ